MRYSLILILFFSISSILFSQNDKVKNNIDWSNPDNIDPINEKTGEFLDKGLESYILFASYAELEGRYMEAAKYYLYILRYDYRNAYYIYKLAKCYALMKRAKLACTYLIRAVNAGFNDYEHIESDLAFEGIKESVVFKKTMKEINNYSKTFGTVKYIKACKLIKCRMKLPSDFDQNNAYTLIIGLHGNGGNTDILIGFGDEFIKNNYIFVCPEGPYIRPQSSGNFNAEYSWEIQVPDIELWKRGDPLSIEYIVNVADYFMKNYKIKNIYLFGFSQGAAYAYITAIKNYEIFKGIIAISGILPSINQEYSLFTEEQLAKGNNLEVFIGHGLHDVTINKKFSKNAQKRLKKAGYDINLITFDAGHIITKELIDETLLWLEEKEKE